MEVSDIAAPKLVDICKLPACQQIGVLMAFHAIGSAGFPFPYFAGESPP